MCGCPRRRQRQARAWPRHRPGPGGRAGHEGPADHRGRSPAARRGGAGQGGVGRPSLTAPGAQSPEVKARVPAGLQHRLEREAKRRGATTSTLIRDALYMSARWVGSHGRSRTLAAPRPMSCTNVCPPTPAHVRGRLRTDVDDAGHRDLCGDSNVVEESATDKCASALGPPQPSSNSAVVIAETGTCIQSSAWVML
jgi:hypothetical protein